MDAEQQSLVLTILDTAGIQPYVFGTNNLRQSIGASEAVRWATQGAARATLIEVCGEDAVNVTADGNLLERYLAFPPEGRTATLGLKAEWINAGGGNTQILFRDRTIAEEFVRTLSLRLLNEAAGLTLVATHVAVESGAVLTERVNAAIKAVNRKKRNRQWATPQLGLGVTASCQFTGLPATTEYSEESEPGILIRVSREVHDKRRHYTAAQERLQSLLVDELGAEYELLKDFDQLGTKGEASFMGVVHIDGNGMGKRVKELADQYTSADQNRAYIEAIRAFSASIEAASQEALRYAVSALIMKLSQPDQKPLDQDEGRKVLPFRPIVYGGDDITFVCDGRHALSLAQLYMEKLEEQALADKERNRLYVRGGVAIVKSHYPFARAYELAEDLAKSAKKFIKALKPDGPPHLSAMDWHFATTGLVLGLTEVRRREYSCTHGPLTMRPVLIHAYDGITEWRRWENFTLILDNLGVEPWVDKRNKIKALREILRQGPDATARFIDSFGSGHQFPQLDYHIESVQRGWIGERCAWADAIEALDLFDSLTPKKTGSVSAANGGDA